MTQFTAAEVGYALAGFKRKDGEFECLPEGSYRILLLRYADGKDEDARVLIRELLAGLGKRMDWVDRCAYTAICRAVVSEFLKGRRCDTCQGRQTVMNGDLVKTCGTCEGAGYHPLSIRARADNIGIPPPRLRKAKQWISTKSG